MSKNRVDEIYNMILASDGDFDTVAQIITDDLNAALARYQEKDKETAAQELADRFNEFISTYYPNSKVKYNSKMILDAMDFESKFEKANNLTDVLDMFCDVLENFDSEKSDSEPKTLEEMIKNKGW